MEAGRLTSRPGSLRPGGVGWGKTRYPLYRRLGGLQGWSERVRKISNLPEFVPWIVQPVASRFADWAIPAQVRVNLLDRNITVLKKNAENYCIQVYGHFLSPKHGTIP